jgi:hypothetical protein
MPTSPTHRLALLAGVGLLAALPLAGCSNSSDTASTTPAASAAASTPAPAASGGAACEAADAVRTSLQGLLSLNVLKDGTDALKANFATFKADVEALIPAAQEQFAPETTAVKTSVADLQTALDGLKADPSVAEAAALAPALASVKTSTQALLDAVGTAC